MANQDLWENLCVRVANYVVGVIPSVVNNGFHQWGLDCPPLTDLALPDVSDYDTGYPLIGFCYAKGETVEDIGNGILSLTGFMLNGLDTAALTTDQTVSFPTPDVTMNIPLTFGTLTVTGNLQVAHSCAVQQPDGSCGTPYVDLVKGTVTVNATDASITITVGGLDENAGQADAVTISWVAQPALSLDVQGLTGTTSAAVHTVENYLAVAKRDLTVLLMTELTNLIEGQTSIGPGGQTLPGALLSLINQAFDKTGDSE